MSRALQENPEKRASLLDMQDLMEAGISEGHIECAKDQTSLRPP